MPQEKHPERLSLALEPEAAVIFCQTVSTKIPEQQEQAIETSIASCYLIVDIGGGTVDISAHCLIEGADRHIRIIEPPTGNSCGGILVNKQFRNFLEILVQDKGFKSFLATSDSCLNARNQAYFNELINETFEIQKILFGNKELPAKGGMLSIELPYHFLKTYFSKLQEAVRTNSDAELVGQDLRITNDKMITFFKPVCDGIIMCIKDILDGIEGKIKKIYFVGGFGGSKYLLQEIEKYFGAKTYQYVVPYDPFHAVVKGALLQYQHPDVFKFRKVDATYGVETNSDFISGIHDPDYCWTNDDGKLKCSSLFSTIVEQGDLVAVDEVFTSVFYPIYHNQKSLKFEFYSCTEKDVWYVTGKRGKSSRTTKPAIVQKLGTIEIEMPNLKGDKNRAVDLIVDFSYTEIQVKAFDRTSKNQVKTVIDFLTSF